VGWGVIDTAATRYARAFVAEMTKFPLLVVEDHMRRLTAAEAPVVVQCIEALLCEAEFVGLVKGLPDGPT
jgi:hypothetical protein